MTRPQVDGLDRKLITAGMQPAPRKGRDGGGMWSGCRSVRPAILALSVLAMTAACGRGPTEDILRGGVPARTDLHQSTGLPPDAVRTVNRNDAGWRLIFHPGNAPAGAEQEAARALCGLERRAVAQIVRLPLDAPYDDPGASKIDIICA